MPVKNPKLVAHQAQAISELPYMTSPMKALAFSLVLLTFACVSGTTAPVVADPLPSWNDGPAKQAIIQFVRDTTDMAGPKYVPPEDRIVTFDEDGTTWVEHPMYTEIVFAMDRVVELSANHPEWKQKMPFKAIIERDREAMSKFGMKELMEVIVATHTGITTDEFNKVAKEWIAKARDPRWKRPYTDLVYQPMLEVMKYLRANGYKTYIVTGGTQPFVRSFAQEAYGIPPEQIIGTSVTTRFTTTEAGNKLLLDPKLLLNNNYAGKAEDIYLFTGRRPNAAFGNTEGDFQMLEYNTAGGGARLGMLLMHDDAEREYAYGPANGLPDTKVGAFSQKLYDDAKAKGWHVISMKKDWNRIFKFDPEVAPTPASDVTAIDILLLPDETMLKHAQATNDRLRKVFPKGFALDATHHPHITLVQRFVPTENLDKVYAAVGKVFASAHLTDLKLEAFKYYYIPDNELGLSGIVIKPTPELLKLEQDVIDAVTPFVVKTGTSAAFVTTPENPEVLPALIEYVTSFVPKSSGEHYHPHVTTGLATRKYLDNMLAEPFESFTFSPVGAAVYHLGHYGTAAKRLKAFDSKP